MEEHVFSSAQAWTPPAVPENIAHGDMPGDSVHIGQNHIAKANAVFPWLLENLTDLAAANPFGRLVVSVCGGSGVGKSETASLLSFYFQKAGLGSYTLSGDNYPHRIPLDNDAERLRIFRVGGMKGLVQSGQCTPQRSEQIRSWQAEARDAEPSLAQGQPWMAAYQRAGRAALASYLGSPAEIDFTELNTVISQFKNGADSVWLKRMGREETALWYDAVDMTGVRVLVVEWTHGNSNYLQGVDVPVLLNSTPAETLTYRRSRHRDGGTDSPFTTMVLALEQQQLEAQAHKAKLIVSRDGELLTYPAYRRLMVEE